MLKCVPLGMCSWDYRVLDGDGELILTYNWMTEQGTIRHGGREYRVVKHGWTSGHWTLEGESGVVAEAQKSSAFTRTMEVRAGTLGITARPKMMSRQFTLEGAGRSYGWIAPAHAFTRRATIECASEVPVLVQAFIFWLVALMWKRASDSSDAATTASSS